jgi:hypothetical protein
MSYSGNIQLQLEEIVLLMQNYLVWYFYLTAVWIILYMFVSLFI